MSGGWGRGGRWLVGAQNSVPSAAVWKQQSLTVVRFHGTLNFFFELLIGFFFPVNLVVHVEIH